MDCRVKYILLLCYLFINQCITSTGCKRGDQQNLNCKDCPPGYLGRNCSDRCRYPSYGMECQKSCDCEERFCDIATGCFLPNDGCRDGFFGDRCVNKCRYPSYGKDCQDSCQCSETACNFMTGCDISKHEQLKAENRSQHIAFGITSFTVIVAVSILSSILISAAITLAIWRLKGPYRWNRRVSQNMSRQLGQQGSSQATTQQPHHVAFDSRQRTNDYCFKVNNRPSHTYCSTIEVSTILPPSDINRPELQRENSSDTTVYDIGSCTYEPVVFPVREEH